MLVKDCMTRHPVMVRPSTSAAEAEHLMNENQVRHLPVVGDGKRMLGMLTPLSFALDPGLLGSLDVWEITRNLNRLTVADIMTPAADLPECTPDETIEQAALRMVEERVSGLVVLESDDIVVGILTEVDVLHALQIMLGLPSPGVRVTMRMPNKSGQFAKLTTVLGDHDWCVMGIGTFPSPRREGMYDAVVKIANISIEEAMNVLSHVEDQELIDIRSID